MIKDKYWSICVTVPFTNKSGKLKFNVKLITPMGTLAYWHKTAREVQRTIISYFLQTLLHTSKNLVGSSVSYLFRVLFSLFFSWQFTVSSSAKSCEAVENRLILIMWFDNGTLARRHFFLWLINLRIIIVSVFLFRNHIKYFSGYICIRRSSKIWWEYKE